MPFLLLWIQIHWTKEPHECVFIYAFHQLLRSMFTTFSYEWKTCVKPVEGPKNMDVGLKRLTIYSSRHCSNMKIIYLIWTKAVQLSHPQLSYKKLMCYLFFSFYTEASVELSIVRFQNYRVTFRPFKHSDIFLDTNDHRNQHLQVTWANESSWRKLPIHCIFDGIDHHHDMTQRAEKLSLTFDCVVFQKWLYVLSFVRF